MGSQRVGHDWATFSLSFCRSTDSLCVKLSFFPWYSFLYSSNLGFLGLSTPSPQLWRSSGLFLNLLSLNVATTEHWNPKWDPSEHKAPCDWSMEQALPWIFTIVYCRYQLIMPKAPQNHAECDGGTNLSQISYALDNVAYDRGYQELIVHISVKLLVSDWLIIMKDPQARVWVWRRMARKGSLGLKDKNIRN